MVNENVCYYHRKEHRVFGSVKPGTGIALPSEAASDLSVGNVTQAAQNNQTVKHNGVGFHRKSAADAKILNTEIKFGIYRLFICCYRSTCTSSGAFSSFAFSIAARRSFSLIILLFFLADIIHDAAPASITTKETPRKMMVPTKKAFSTV